MSMWLSPIFWEKTSIPLLLQLPYTYTLFYPATSASFKNHEEIIYALNEFKKNAAPSIGVYLTITAEEDKELTELIQGLNLQENVHF